MPASQTQSGDRIPGRATRAGTQRYAERFAHLPGHFRRPDDLWLSSLALGMRRGRPGGVDDLLYRSAIDSCLSKGCNVFVTALSDRVQTSERALGHGLRRAFSEGIAARDEVVVATMGGQLVPEPEDMTHPGGANRSLYETYVDTGLVDPGEIANGHCLEPRFLLDQIERSRRNLNLETLDFFLLQEPELHLRSLGPGPFWERMEEVFRGLESAVHGGLIASYGVSSWDGFLVPGADRHHLSISDLFRVALDAGGADHHLRVLQFPYGLAAGETLVLDSQLGPDGKTAPLLDLLRETGTTVLASAPLFGGRLLGRVPDLVHQAFPTLKSDAHCCLQFVRSTQNVTSAVIGMREPDHVEHNLALAETAPADSGIPLRLFSDAGARR